MASLVLQYGTLKLMLRYPNLKLMVSQIGRHGIPSFDALCTVVT